MAAHSNHHHSSCGSKVRRLPLSFSSRLLLAMMVLLCFCSTSRRSGNFMIAVGVNGADDDVVVERPQHRLQNLLEPPEDYVDDIYHCDNPLDTENNIIQCNFVTFKWVVTELVPDSPPQECNDYILLAAAISTEGFQDKDEPCVLWYMMYGGVPPFDTNVAPSPFFNEENTEAPTHAPMEAPTQEPTTMAALTDPPSGTIIHLDPDDTSSSEDLDVQAQDNPLHKAIGPFTLTYIWPENNNRLFAYELNRSELHTITSQHILEALQAELGLSNVKHVNLILTPSQPSPRTRTETLTGNAVLLNLKDDEQQQPTHGTATTIMITQQQLQQIVAAAFQGNAMELYLFRLQIAKDVALRSIIQVVLGTDGDNRLPQENGGNPPNGNESNGDVKFQASSFFADNILVITISISAVAAILALCCFGYCLLVSGRRRNKCQKESNDEEKNKPKKIKEVVPAVSTKPTNSQEEDCIGVVIGGGDRNLHRSGGDQLPPPPQMISGEDEENRSLYSYLHNDDEDALSAAPSFLYSTHEADNVMRDSSEISNNKSATEADMMRKNKQKKGILWSVMDSLQSAFANDDDDVDDYDNDGVSPLSIKEEASSRPNSFGEKEEPREKSNPSGIMYKGVLYAEEAPDDDNRSALTFDDNKSMLTYDYDLTVGINGILNDDDRSNLAAETPVRQRFEALWKEDDENDQVRDYLPTTVKKSNVRTMQVYEDDDEEETSDDLDVSTDTADASDDSPHTLLTQASRNPKTDTLLKNDQPNLVDRTPETDSDGDEENNLPLPSAIYANPTRSNHQGDDTSHSETDSIGSNQSMDSGKSNQSNGSNRSSASSRPRFQPTNGAAASATDVGSARKQRTCQWGGAGGTASKIYSFAYQSTSDNQSIGSLKSSATNASQKSSFTTDSMKFRSLLNQEDTNDAALLFNMTQSSNTSGSTEHSNLRATVLSYGDSSVSPSSASSASSLNKVATTSVVAPTQVSTLIQSFDEVWNDDESHADKENDSTNNNNNAMNPVRLESLSFDKSYDKKKGGDDASTIASVYACPTMASF